MCRSTWFSLTARVLVGLAVLSCSPAQAQRGGASDGRIYKARLDANWLAGGTKFWYRNDTRGGKPEFILVDAERGTRQAFEHSKLDEITRADANSRPAANADAEVPRQSRRTGAETELTFINRTPREVELFWLDTSGQRRSYGKLDPGGTKRQHTYAGHVWEAVTAAQETLARFLAEEAASEAVIELGRRPTADRAPRGRTANSTGTSRSPDGKWTVMVRDHNVILQGADAGQDVQLTHDGREGLGYGMLNWSPDSQSLVAFRIKPAERKSVYLVESSPRGGGRAVLHERPYALPGDEFSRYELRLFNVANRAPIECELDAMDFGTPRVRFRADGRTFTFEQIDRGHQRLRLVEVDVQTGASRNLIDERTDTFIWTAHAESVGVPRYTWLSGNEELIYASERDGWRHLYLVDVREGAIKNQITNGEYVVRGIDYVDEENRQLWFRASGRNADQDPYFVHHYRVNFDGTDLIALTEDDGNHTVQFSPDRKYLIDTYSRVDQPPVHALRRTSDGKLVCRLEEADTSELNESGWQAPEVFTAKGRDGKTDIWGVIYRPRDFDRSKKYPVIEQIYAGPHGSHVPKSFSGQRRHAALTNLGFVVVQIDGMGTANRSKAFHDVCWKNLKDAGLPDRILWHQAAAEKYPWYDISRVGIYGTSAGGQNSTAALLFHPEFYKVGVSACGCHDNRMDKASWNEQWMGYPVGPQYAESSNIDNASRLQGKLLLIVGEMDTNVPPESTFRLADALIKADKDFDLVVVPGAGHGMGGAYGARRMHDFFVRHLLGGE